MKYKNHSGEKYYMLTVIKYAYKKKNHVYWECVCDCGKQTFKRIDCMKTGNDKSCGCYNKSKNKKRNTIRTHGDTGKRLYRIWAGMKTRCNTKSSSRYKYYGAKGIKIYNEWNNYKIFKEWALKNGYTELLTIDRINSIGNYQPNNCRWINMKEQARNRKNSIYINYQGQNLHIKQWAEKLNISYNAIINRLKINKNPEFVLRKNKYYKYK